MIFKYPHQAYEASCCGSRTDRYENFSTCQSRRDIERLGPAVPPVSLVEVVSRVLQRNNIEEGVFYELCGWRESFYSDCDVSPDGRDN